MPRYVGGMHHLTNICGNLYYIRKIDMYYIRKIDTQGT
jgi:hypothetical protein